MRTPPSLAEVRAQLTAPGARFELTTLDIRGVPTRVFVNAHPTLRALLEASRQHGERDFLVYEDERLTFSGHFRAVAAFAHALVHEFGVRPGDRVAIAMRNLPEWSVAFWATTAVGAVSVPLNAWWTAGELDYGLEDSGASLIVADAQRASLLLPRWADRLVVVERDAPRVEGWPAPGMERAARWDDVLSAAGDHDELPPADLGPEDLATIFYTSGTTGKPKGALGTHRNICTNPMTAAYFGSRAALRATSEAAAQAATLRSSAANSYLLGVPLFHVTGCHSVLVGNLMNGGKITLMHRWDATRALELIERERITSFGGVPTLAWQVLTHPDFDRYDTSSIGAVAYGGAPAAPELVRRINELLPGRSISNGYGMTETSSLATMNSGSDYERKPDSVGLPTAVCDLRIVDGDGRELPPGAIGELLVKGPNVVVGYWGNPAATEGAISADGWLRTGDVARLDDEGFLYIVDRAKDVVIRGGENVYCTEVEAALYEHPAVVDVAVFGVPHPILGEEVAAVVQTRPGPPVAPDELRGFLAGRLAAFKVPAHVWVRDEALPRNPNGKVLKRELRAEVTAADRRG